MGEAAMRLTLVALFFGVCSASYCTVGNIYVDIEEDFCVISDLAGNSIKKLTLGANPVLTTVASVASPKAIGIRYDGSYAAFSNANDVLQQIDMSTGVVSPLAGRPPGPVYYADGTGTNAVFYGINDVKFLKGGTPMVQVTSNLQRYLRRVDFSGQVTTVLGGNADGVVDGYYSTAYANFAPGRFIMSQDGFWMLYTSADYRVVRKVAYGEVRTVVGPNDGSKASGCANGYGTNVRFRSPTAMTTGRSDVNTAYVLDAPTIRRLRLDQSTTYEWLGNCAGTGTVGVAGTGVGAGFNFFDIALSPAETYMYGIDASGVWKILMSTVEVTKVQTLPTSTYAFDVSRFVLLCDACPVGFYCTGDFSMTACGATFYCPRGSYSLLSCPAGYFCVNASVATACSAGEICPAGSTSRATCPAGFFCQSTSTQTACPAGSFCGPGSAAPTACASSQYCAVGSSTAVKCPVNFYCPNPAIKIACPSGATCPLGSTQPVDAGVCSAGSYVVSGGGTDFAIVADNSNHVIKKITMGPSPSIATIAGLSGVYTADPVNGPGSDARFWSPTGVALTSDGQQAIVGDRHDVIRLVNTATGEVRTLAGQKPVSVYYQDGTGTDAIFYAVRNIENIGNSFYVSSSGHNFVRKVTYPDGVATTVIGVANVYGNTDGFFPVGAGKLNSGEYFLSPDGSYFMYVSDWMKIIRKVTIATKYVETMAGSYRSDGCVNGLGMDTRFGLPGKILFLDNMYVLVADPLTFTIRKLRTDTGATTAWIGNCDGTGTPNVAATGLDVRIGFQDMVFSPDKATIYGMSTTSLWKIDVATSAVTKVVDTGVPTPRLAFFKAPPPCNSCALGSYCVAGSTSEQPCPAGSMCPTPSTIYPCGPGTFCLAGSTSASPCTIPGTNYKCA